jgi:hypothetical protein
LWAGTQPSFAQNSTVSVAVSARVPPKCVLRNPTPVVDLGQLKQTGSASVSFSLSCNTNFYFVLSSQNGGFVQAGAQARPPFLALIPYTVSPHLGTPRIWGVDRCLSSNMISPFPPCSGIAAANADSSGQNASLAFSWNFSGSIPLSGSFRDTLVLTVGPSL